jgi:hypothetical protein
LLHRTGSYAPLFVPSAELAENLQKVASRFSIGNLGQGGL